MIKEVYSRQEVQSVWDWLLCWRFYLRYYSVSRQGYWQTGMTSRCQRILYLLDGSICGELKLPDMEKGAEKLREEKVNQWLIEMGW